MAEISCGRYFWSPSATVTSCPIFRLIDRIVRSGASTNWLRAACRRAAGRPRIEADDRRENRVAILAQYDGPAALMTATSLFVVPRSMPMMMSGMMLFRARRCTTKAQRSHRQDHRMKRRDPTVRIFSCGPFCVLRASVVNSSLPGHLHLGEAEQRRRSSGSRGGPPRPPCRAAGRPRPPPRPPPSAPGRTAGRRHSIGSSPNGGSARSTRRRLMAYPSASAGEPGGAWRRRRPCSGGPTSAARRRPAGRRTAGRRRRAGGRRPAAGGRCGSPASSGGLSPAPPAAATCERVGDVDERLQQRPSRRRPVVRAPAAAADAELQRLGLLLDGRPARLRLEVDLVPQGGELGHHGRQVDRRRRLGRAGGRARVAVLQPAAEVGQDARRSGPGSAGRRGGHRDQLRQPGRRRGSDMRPPR